ncbi:MAG: hypothetical protein WAV41_03045 [Microgenomates group bacterium]
MSRKIFTRGGIDRPNQNQDSKSFFAEKLGKKDVGRVRPRNQSSKYPIPTIDSKSGNSKIRN